ncbi:MAG: type II toxin-antitoxin system RelE/ParE family toxin [Bacteroidota bacterium]|nr:type II toxin-antitoxin system RelE/ParE family toxin [Bacteroidota bacterium]
MEIKWAIEAQKDYHKSIEYWEEHNGTFDYSLKIIQAVEKLEAELSQSPIYFGRYSKKLKLYVRPILKGRFLVYFDIDETKNVIEIVYFKTPNQKHLE